MDIITTNIQPGKTILISSSIPGHKLFFSIHTTLPYQIQNPSCNEGLRTNEKALLLFYRKMHYRHVRG
jgi:hypothetical protein